MAAVLCACSSSEFDLGGATSPDTGVVEDVSADGPVEDSSALEDTSTVDTAMPDSDVPVDAVIVDSGSPKDTAMPDTFVPDTFVADTFMPDSFMPDSFMPDTFVPDTFVMDSFMPDSFMPDTFMPDTFMPDTFVPPDTITPIDTGGGTSCTLTSECATNWFCYKTGCSAPGTCKPMPTSGLSDYGPVCGCDGVTYWNSFHAANYSIGVASNGPCTGAGRKTCTAAGACDSFPNSECVFELSGSLACGDLTPVGTCWRTPSGKTCPLGASGPVVRACSTVCMSHCEAVKTKVKFHPGSVCVEPI